MISPKVKLSAFKNLPTFSDTSIATAIGININRVKKKEVKYFFNKEFSVS